MKAFWIKRVVRRKKGEILIQQQGEAKDKNEGHRLTRVKK